MHIKTDIEHDLLHVVILAICPLMFLFTGLKEALYMILLTLPAFAVSVILCATMDRKLSKTAKVFITALISSLMVTVVEYLMAKNHTLGFEHSQKYYFAILASVILTTDFYYIDTRAILGNMFYKVSFAILMFSGIYALYAIIIEVLGSGTLLEIELFKGFQGIAFFKSVTFGFILLGFMCLIGDIIYRYIDKKISENNIIYQKYIKKIRNEKIFQYDKLRREGKLSVPVETRYIDSEAMELIKEKSNENTSLTENEENDKVEKVEPKENKPKKVNEMKVSKEAKIEQVFDRQTRGGK